MIDDGAFLEYARVFDRYYGTSAGETERWLAPILNYEPARG